jgi:CelD/BcsL family acetyltransferase involved in cellulose biosynthesis
MAPAMSSSSLPLRLGRRTLWRFERLLLRQRVTLEEGLTGDTPPLPALSAAAAGYFVSAVPAEVVPALRARHPELKGFVRQRYSRSCARLDLTFEDYLEGFSARSRSTLRRKVRRLAERSGGALDVRMFRTVDEVDAFHRHARSVSARSYQERQLGAGLPDGEAARADMSRLAAADALRGWVLFLEGHPIAYLHAPAEEDTLIYAHLGHDPDFAEWSPGTVLQFEAMRQLMAERRFRWFDFTEGDGQHKRLFATDSLDCVDLLLLRRTPANLFIGHSLTAFDAVVERTKRTLARLGVDRAIRWVIAR